MTFFQGLISLLVISLAIEWTSLAPASSTRMLLVNSALFINEMDLSDIRVLQFFLFFFKTILLYFGSVWEGLGWTIILSPWPSFTKATVCASSYQFKAGACSHKFWSQAESLASCCCLDEVPGLRVMFNLIDSSLLFCVGNNAHTNTFRAAGRELFPFKRIKNNKH